MSSVRKIKEAFGPKIPTKIYISGQYGSLFFSFKENHEEYFKKSLNIYRPLNYTWLIKNNFINLKDLPITISYKILRKYSQNKREYAFIGEYTRWNQPGGFIRIVNQYGSLYEGEFTSDVKMDGFCISFIGYTNTISVGWYL